MLLSIIIVSYNTKELTTQTVTTAQKQLEKSKLLQNSSEIIVIDNNSQDNTLTALKKLKSTIPLYTFNSGTNLGFGKANNLGVQKAKGKYLLFLNSDTVIEDNSIELMVQRFEDQVIDEDINDLGVLSATLLNKDLTLQPQGGNFPTLSNLFFHMSMLDDLPIVGKYLPSTQHTGKNSKEAKHYDFKLSKKTHKQLPQRSKKNAPLIYLDWVTGTAVMFPKTVIEEIGFWDPNIFMYGEDVEICIRANNHHYQVAIDPTTQVIHLQNQSSSSKNAIIGEFQGYLYIYSKHYTSTKLALAKSILSMGAFLRIFIFSTLKKDKNKVAIYRYILKEVL